MGRPQSSRIAVWERGMQELNVSFSECRISTPFHLYPLPFTHKETQQQRSSGKTCLSIATEPVLTHFPPLRHFSITTSLSVYIGFGPPSWPSNMKIGISALPTSGLPVLTQLGVKNADLMVPDCWTGAICLFQLPNFQSWTNIARERACTESFNRAARNSFVFLSGRQLESVCPS